MAKPFLKWVGGKSALVPELLKHVPPSYRVYHELFVGGGALFFSVGGTRPAVLNDANEELIHCYRVVRDDPNAVIRLLNEIAHSKETYTGVRALDPATMPTHVRAARFIYLNKTCFNGLWRVNRSGQFNVPMGKYKNPRYADAETLFAASAALQCVRLTSTTFEEAAESVEKDDFVYLDPPYDPVSETSKFTSYTKTPFGWAEQQRLAEVCEQLHQRGARFVLSNAPTERIVNLYKKFNQRTVQARRSINSKGSKRGPVSELLVWNTP